MPRYELSDGKSNKFWKIELDNTSFTTTYGRIGTSGQSKTKSFASAAEAQKEHDKIVAQKLKKGYVKVAGGPASSAAAPVGATSTASVPADLLAAIRGNPSDQQAKAVLADAMQEAGDPRGQLAAVQLALPSAQGAKRKELEQGQASLFAQHGKSWLPESVFSVLKEQDATSWGTFDDKAMLSLRWEAGFVVQARLGGGIDSDDYEHDLETIVGEFLQHPSAQFLRDLHVGRIGIFGEYDYGPLNKLVAAHIPATVEKLFFADFEMEDSEISWSQLGNFEALWSAVPNLSDVTIHGANFTLGTIVLPKAKRFAVQTGGLASEDVRSIANAKWPLLESLEIWFGAEEYGAGGDVNMIQPILEGVGLSKLTHLGLMNSEFADDICRVLPKSKIAKQLTSLDLSMGVMSAEGAEALVADPKAFPKLKKLNVADNFLPDEWERKLSALCENVLFGDQDDDDIHDDEVYRYVSVGE